jgi:hypothetical protein
MRVCLARTRSQRWHSTTDPGVSGGTTCILPQSAQVIVIDQLWRAGARGEPDCVMRVIVKA